MLFPFFANLLSNEILNPMVRTWFIDSNDYRSQISNASYFNRILFDELKTLVKSINTLHIITSKHLSGKL